MSSLEGIFSGAPVDIRSGRPVLPSRARRDAAETEAAVLLEKMSVAGLAESDAARLMMAEIEAILTTRIEEVLSKDEQAKACVRIMKAVGNKTITGKDAARKYVERFSAGGPVSGRTGESNNP
jgi:hypothetical protein